MQQFKRQQADAFLFYKRRQIQEQIHERTQSRLQQLSSTAAHNESATASSDIPLQLAEKRRKVSHNCSSTAATSDTTIPVAHEVPVAKRLALPPIVPGTIVNLWSQLHHTPSGGLPNPPVCKCKQCPYSVGPLMQQRYNLMLKLWFLEKSLFGV